jgi:RHS repeat-associated protein
LEGAAIHGQEGQVLRIGRYSGCIGLKTSGAVSVRAADLAYQVAKVPQRYALGNAREGSDKDALAAYREKHRELAEELEKAKADNSEAERDRIRGEKEWLEEHVKKELGLGGRLRKFFRAAIRRVVEEIAKIIPLYADSQNPTTPTGYDRTDYLFNLDWQVLEERFEGNVGTDLKDAPAQAAHVLYVWDARYIDTPVLRIRDTAGPGGPGPDGTLDAAVDEVVYYLTDANMNVTALVDGTAGSPTAGQVVERYMYDAYGKATILNGPADADNHPDATPPATVADWSPDADQKSDLGNTIFFAGYPLDAETGLYCVRRRYYGPTIGRWTSVAPEVYGDGMNVYQSLLDSPPNWTDPKGLAPLKSGWEQGHAVLCSPWGPRDGF